MSTLPSNIRYDPTYPTYPILSGLSIALVLIPAYWQFRARNIGTSLYVTWTILGNAIYLINSVVWYGNLEEHSRFWCDLCTKVIVGLSVGLPAASLIINRRLYKIATIQHVLLSRREDRTNTCIELSIGVGLPFMVMILHVMSQGHRYDVLENIGCYPTTYVTPVTLLTVFIWPIIISLISAVYASLSIWAFVRQRRAFVEALQSVNSDLNVNRYFRLMALAGTELAFSLPFSTYLTVTDCKGGLYPWISWAVTHYQFNRTSYVPFGFVLAIYPNTFILCNISRYSLPVGGIFFFIYLGMSGESGRFLKRCIDCLRRRCGWKSPADTALQSPWAARSGAKSARTVRRPRQSASLTSLSSSSWGGKQACLTLNGLPVSIDRQDSLASDTTTFSPRQHVLAEGVDEHLRIPARLQGHNDEATIDSV